MAHWPVLWLLKWLVKVMCINCTNYIMCIWTFTKQFLKYYCNPKLKHGEFQVNKNAAISCLHYRSWGALTLRSWIKIWSQLTTKLAWFVSLVNISCSLVCEEKFPSLWCCGERKKKENIILWTELHRTFEIVHWSSAWETWSDLQYTHLASCNW